MKWITRERPKIDRIACPWLVRRFVDPQAEFLYVAPDRVLAEAQRLEAIPYDVPGVELTHQGELCSFDAIIRKYGLRDPALDRLADIVRAADTDTLSRSLALAGGGPAARDVRAIDSRQHDVERREVPRAARVTILQLVPDQHDLASRAHGVGLLAGAEIVTPDPTFRRGPDRARDEA
jgi:hypothetical protein